MVTSELSTILINGKSCASLAVSDRGLTYGHGVFETIRLNQGQPILWRQHMVRLLQSCIQLRIETPHDLSTLLLSDVQALSDSNTNAVIKIIITAGTGGRGYSIPEKADTQRVVMIFPLPEYPTANAEQGVKVITCDYRLPLNPRLAGMKHLNRLDQVMARSEWSNANIAEGIVLDVNHHVVEGTMSNLFGIKNGNLLTPSLEQAGVKGVMRDFVVDTALARGFEVQEVSIGVDEFKKADELFVTNSVIGLWPIKQWDKHHYHKGDLTRMLQCNIERLCTEQQSGDT